jgi:ribosomal protein L29
MKVTELPKSPKELATLEAKLRQELRGLERDRALQKLESTAKLKLVRRDIARLLTVKHNLEKS